jgi:hypothetical protein
MCMKTTKTWTWTVILWAAQEGNLSQDTLKTLPVTTVKGVSRSGGDLTGLLVVTTPLVVDDSAPLVRYASIARPTLPRCPPPEEQGSVLASLRELLWVGGPRLYVRVLIPKILQRSERWIRANIGAANPVVGTRFGCPSTWYYLDQWPGFIVQHLSCFPTRVSCNDLCSVNFFTLEGMRRLASR